MLGKHELNELAPRDIVARAITRELIRSGETHAYIDITSQPREYLEHRFPTIFNECLKRGMDISKVWIPVCPVQHYLIGGIQTDLDARTPVEGLYACGEAASTGVHGANRLASNSMLECLVFGRRAAAHINVRLEGLSEAEPSKLPACENRTLVKRDFAALRIEIQQLMNDCGSVLRNEKGMTRALARISEISEELKKSYYPGREYIETLNIAALAVDILKAALLRKESVGAHYRED